MCVCVAKQAYITTLTWCTPSCRKACMAGVPCSRRAAGLPLTCPLLPSPFVWIFNRLPPTNVAQYRILSKIMRNIIVPESSLARIVHSPRPTVSCSRAGMHRSGCAGYPCPRHFPGASATAAPPYRCEARANLSSKMYNERKQGDGCSG